MKRSFAFYIVIILVTLFSCTKQVSELPPATQTGANTFGCKVDGKFWVPAGFGIVPTAPTLEARFAGNGLFINARNFSSSPTETEFEIFLYDVPDNGNYVLNTTAAYPTGLNSSYAYYVHRRFSPDNEWITSSPYIGTVNITKIDRANKIVSGTFEFQAVSLYDPAQTISITEGRFDVKTQ
jgi:Family of unknown function (DUF6252)